MNDLDLLMGRWLRATGEQMPAEFQQLPIHLIRRALKRVKAGDTVFIPKTVEREFLIDSDLADLDRQDRMW